MKHISDISEGVSQVSTNASRGSDTLQEIIATGKRAAGAALIATAALVSANCGGGSDSNPEPPVTPPTNPNKPQDRDVSYSAPGVLSEKAATPVSLAADKVGMPLNGLYVGQSGQNVVCEVPDQNKPEVITSVRPESVGTEGDDTCIVKATTPGQAVQPDNVIVTMHVGYDAKAPEWENSAGKVTVTTNASQSSLDVSKILPAKPDKTGVNYSVDPRTLPSYLHLGADKYTITWDPSAISYENITVTVYATDGAGHVTPGNVSMRIYGSYVEPVTPPVGPTCPPGMTYVPATGTCM